MSVESSLIIKYKNTLNKNPRSRVFAPLAECYKKLGLYEEAIKILRDGIKLNPDYVLAYMSLSSCHFYQGNIQYAYDILMPHTKSNRDNLKLLKLFAKICMSLKIYDEALESMKYGLFLNPRDHETAAEIKSLEELGRDKFGPVCLITDGETNNDKVKELDQQQNYSFETSSLNAVPEHQIDDFENEDVSEWESVDLTGETSNDISLDEWKSHTLESTENVEQTSHVEKKRQIISRETESDTDEAPVITHTLVDLYITQGHIDKAMSLLQKILELNSGDIKTRKRLEELQDEFCEQNPTLSMVKDVEDEVCKQDGIKTVLDEKDEREDYGRDVLMAAIDKSVFKPEEKSKNDIIIDKLNRFKDLLQEKQQNT